MKLGVAIVTYNRLDLLKECIDACLNQTVKFSDIYIVNNASTDGTTEYLKSIKDKSVHIINSNTNLGGAGGFYLGIEEATKKDLDYLLIIDDDAIIDSKYNESILPYIGKNDVKAFSGSVVTDGMIQYEHRRHMDSNFNCTNSNENEYKKDYFDYELATFCGLYVSMDIIKKIGLPKKEFFIWFDDTEYSIRILKYTKIRNVNKAFLNHKTKVAVNKGYNWKSFYSIRNQIVIMKEYFSKLVLFKFKLNIYLHIIYSKIIGFIKRDKYYKVVADMYREALYDGMKNKLGKNEKYTPNNGDIFKR